MTTLHEYDLQTKPKNIFRGLGFCKLAVEAQDHKNDNNDDEEDRTILWDDMTAELSWENESQMF